VTGADLLLVIALSAAIAAAVGAAAWVVLRSIARAPIVVHLITVVVAAVAAVVAGVLVAAQAMYLSEHDARVTIAITVTSGTVAVITASILGSLISRSARALRAAAEDLERDVPVQARPLPVKEFRDVLDQLAASDTRLRTARDAITRQEGARNDLVTRIAHDLRVPLAGIRAQAEALQDGLAPEPDRYLAQITAQVDRVDALVSDLFAVSQIDAGTLAPRLERVSVADVASDAAADFRTLADAAGIRLDISVADGGVVDADAGQLTRAIANLLANAVQHVSPGGHVLVTVRTDGDRVRVGVEDDGPGFAPGEAMHAFEAGWRGSAARSPHRLDLTGGAGLGLAIVRGIARAHGGDATAANRPQGGARVEIQLPATTAAG
jgi:signal transduction histidine kinase